MRKWLLLLFVGLLVTPTAPSPASAQGDMQLAWNACRSAGGSTDLAFPCGGGDGTPKATLFGSFKGAPHQPHLVAMDGQVELFMTKDLPDFFRFATQMEPGNCNPGLVFGVELPTACTGTQNLCGSIPPGGECDFAFGVLTQTTMPSLAPNRAKMIFSVFRTSIIDAAANTEYFVFRIDFYADMAVESGGSCSGCADGASLVFDRLGLLAPTVEGYQNYEVINFDCAEWNFSGASPCYAVPTRNRTWGALKSLYR